MVDFTEDKKECAFCGATKNIIQLHVPEYFQHNVFCKTTNCYRKYDKYMFQGDESKGIPYAVSKYIIKNYKHVVKKHA